MKTPVEIAKDLPAIRCSAVIVQHDQNTECGSICLYVLKQLTNGIPFSNIIEFLERRYNTIPTADLMI